MFAFPEQITSAARSNLESQLARFSALTNHAFTGMEKLVSLNFAAVKASAQESLEATNQLVTTGDPKEFFSRIQATPASEKLASYNRHLTEILATTREEFARDAQAQFAEARANVTALVDEAAKNAPPGAEKAVAMLKSIIANPGSGYQPSSATPEKIAEQAAEHPANTPEVMEAIAEQDRDKHVSAAAQD